MGRKFRIEYLFFSSVGDVHDFVKYALLRSLSKQLGLRRGGNWYHTRTEPDSSDGDNRAYLSSGPKWAKWEPDLFKRIEGLQDLSDRCFGRVSELGILPACTIFHEDQVPTVDRKAWHDSARKALKYSHLVSLDPDNGPSRRGHYCAPPLTDPSERDSRTRFLT